MSQDGSVAYLRMMTEQYPREILLDEFFERREERLLEVDADVARPIYEIVAELDPQSPVQAVTCFGYFEEYVAERDDEHTARVNILYEDGDSSYEHLSFRDGYWRAPVGYERIAIRLGNELISAIGGYVLLPNKQELDDFTDKMAREHHGDDEEGDSCGMWRPRIPAGTNNQRHRKSAGRWYDCQMRDRWE